MALTGEHTVITYDEEHRITQLDTYISETARNEVFIGIDLALFSRCYPLTGGIDVRQYVADCEEGGNSYAVAQIGRLDDKLTYEEGVDVDDLANAEVELTVLQHVGKLGLESISIATTTYDIKQAEKDAPECIEGAAQRAEYIEDILQDFSSN